MIPSNKQTARLAGLLYLIIAITGGFGHFSLHGAIMVPGNATETVEHIRASGMLFRLGFVSNLLCQLCFIVLPLVLYKLLSPINKRQAVLMVVIVLVAVPLACINMLNQFAALLILNGDDYLKAFDKEQTNALVMLFLNLQKYGVLIAQLFWGLWLLPFGYLVIKSGFLPKVLGWLLMVACVAYLIGSFTEFLFPDHGPLLELIYIEPSIAEISVCLYLLIKGVKTEKSPVPYL
jgi:hypothetical protein